MKIRAGRVLRQRAKFSFVPEYVSDQRFGDPEPHLVKTGYRVVPRVRRG